MAWMLEGSPEELTEVPNDTPGSTPGPAPELFPHYAKWLASSLSRYEELARAMVKHRAEKGRVVEGVVKSALRSILPGRFSIGTGFVISASGHTSSQLDLVIYDGHFNAPIILEGGTGLFPIECVYGFVEVKSVLNTKGVEDAARAIGAVRRFSGDKRYVAYDVRSDEDGNKVVGEVELSSSLPPRAFVFAINSAYSELSSLENDLRDATHRNDAHVHGLAVMDKDWFLQQRAYRNPHEFNCREGQALSAFCAKVLGSIQSITVWPASMKRYLGLRSEGSQ